MPKDKKTACLDDLRMRILMQQIAPGADLDEAALCDAYGMSRTPMREVFQRLSGEGYLRTEPNRGPKVASMDLGVMRMFFQTAPLVYANIARLAAENRRTEQIAPLRSTQDAFRAATVAGDASQAALLNHRFHEEVGEMAHNPYLMPALRRMLIDHTRLSQTFYRPKSADEKRRVQTACVHHDQMIAAIEAQEPDRAVALTLEHWDLSRDRLEQFVTPDPLPLALTPNEEHARAV
ncbi:GntR family transcriptional regulator [Pseudohalocynthiibacter aestuariivivens]|uniref:GntR family transcriptional regulator n=1 Tax=Roseovarius pelagicus TaxID=2980108 RepID=A0ABY6D727_9RHOB|nr:MULTISPECIES: GntR family transcriptional regulator [Rhodobacterales]QIE46077.1 GntR family transcriptional regulator [Pseudohalocynthiibacter aestuariivivens]UXX81961.1 GntR family transcriptional regulator [Roseovarius pelagicus]